MKLKVVLERAEEGGYVVYVPSLPGCVSQGETREEALRNIKEAIELYLADIKEPYWGWRGDRRDFGVATPEDLDEVTSCFRNRNGESSYSGHSYLKGDL